MTKGFNMNKNILIAVLIMISVAICSFGQTTSTANKEFPMPVQDNGLISFVTIATPAVTVGPQATAVTGLPAGTKSVTIVAINGILNYGSSSVGTGITYPSIASGSWKEFKVNPLTGTPGIYLCNQTAGATMTAYLRAAFK
jgi:hypothetical protein